jgi:restriction endonuclease Mrr
MRIFISYSHSDGHELAVELTRALAEAGHEVFEPASSLEPGGNLIASISTAIRRAEVVVALLTVPNPNVYYELGMAWGANVPMLVASRNPENMLFALSSAPYVQLTSDVAVDVAAIVRRIREVANMRREFDRDALESAELTLAEAARDPSVLESTTPLEFERLVTKLFQERGFPIRATPHTTDQGFDLIIDGDPPTVVEVKRYSRRSLVSVGTVRALLGAMTAAGAGRAILVSSSGFTRSARAAATEWPIELMTFEDLLRLPGPCARSPTDPGTRE